MKIKKSKYKIWDKIVFMWTLENVYWNIERIYHIFKDKKWKKLDEIEYHISYMACKAKEKKIRKPTKEEIKIFWK